MRNFLLRKINPLKSSQAQETLDKSEDVLLHAKLIESEIRYRRLFETAKDGILILDFETGCIADANPFIIKLIDHPINEILGKKLWEIGLFSNKEESERAFIDLKANGYIRFEDMPIQRRNGKITEVEFISNVYLANDTKVIQCNIRDITERKVSEKALIESEQNLKKQNSDYVTLNNEYSALNEELRESLSLIQNINKELVIAKNEAEESNKLKSAFLKNISHEIRTPMNAIMGFSGFLLQPGLPHEKLENFAQIINASSLQLMSVINDIIDISKIEAGQITINPELFNINHVMNDLFTTYKKIVEPKKICLHYSSDTSYDLVQIKTDGNRIKQVICNLLNNAIKFTPNGKIELGYKIKGNFAEFYVKDTGIGIAPEDHELIFQRFRQVEAKDNLLYAGNGLGLSISKALVEKLGGTITVSSALGEGSTFTFTIPYLKEIENNISPAAKFKSSQFMGWNEKTILIAEDELYNYKYIEESLSHTKVKIIHAWDGSETVEQIKEHADISLVLMDIKMPIMDGYEALRIVKQIRPDLPVIAQTAYAFSQDREQALNAGFDNYISKPISKDVLVDLIASYLN